jgi:hypothetical protein
MCKSVKQICNLNKTFDNSKIFSMKPRVWTRGNVDLAPNKINTLCPFCAMYTYFVGHRNSNQKGPFKVGVYERNVSPQDHYYEWLLHLRNNLW